MSATGNVLDGLGSVLASPGTASTRVVPPGPRTLFIPFKTRICVGFTANPIPECIYWPFPSSKQMHLYNRHRNLIIGLHDSTTPDGNARLDRANPGTVSGHGRMAGAL